MGKGRESGPAGSLKIGEAARRLGVTPRTLRFYEELGLVHPHRTARGTRLYREADLRRLEVVQTLARLGVPLAEAQALARARPGSASGDEASHRVAAILDRLHDRVEAKLRACRDALVQIEAARQVVEACFGCGRPPTRQGCGGCPVAERRHTSRLFDLIWEPEPEG